MQAQADPAARHDRRAATGQASRAKRKHRLLRHQHRVGGHPALVHPSDRSQPLVDRDESVSDDDDRGPSQAAVGAPEPSASAGGADDDSFAGVLADASVLAPSSAASGGSACTGFWCGGTPTGLRVGGGTAGFEWIPGPFVAGSTPAQHLPRRRPEPCRRSPQSALRGRARAVQNRAPAPSPPQTPPNQSPSGSAVTALRNRCPQPVLG